MRAKYSITPIFFLLICIISGKISARTPEADSLVRYKSIDSLVRMADKSHLLCEFDAAIEFYSGALEILEDSLWKSADSLRILSVRDRLLLSENGKSMSSFVYKPAVVAKHKFSLDDFFLYYPLEDESWYNIPNQLDSSKTKGFARATYVPEDAERIYFSAEDQDGIRNMYMTEHQDSVWTAPSLLHENVTSVSNEIYPMLSPDGKTLYFSSSGLYGVGGYDIYMSEWSDADNHWSTPLNMGFPYSSPADDFLFMNTDDGNYTLFASNRECSGDSVWVYVLEYDTMPVRKAVEDTDELRDILELNPMESLLEERDVSPSMPENVDTRRYMDKMVEVRALRDSLSYYHNALDKERDDFAVSEDEEEKVVLTKLILHKEARIPVLQDSLDKAVSKLQQIEMEFLFSGVVIDPEKMMHEADHEVVMEESNYVFKKMIPGDSLNMRILAAEKKFDYSFMVLEEGQFAEDSTIPEGIAYQIQMFSSTKKAKTSNLKGLSPVFEKRTGNGNYIYRVGLFNTYNDVLSKLNTVKRVGFKSAFIVAYIDGKEVSVSKARTEEKCRQEQQPHYRVVIVPENGALDPELAAGIRQQASGKDIARSETEDGKISYIVGTFDNGKSADELVEFIKLMGISEVSAEAVAKENK